MSKTNFADGCFQMIVSVIFLMLILTMLFFVTKGRIERGEKKVWSQRNHRWIWVDKDGKP